jgi:CxxC motif-containing protein (DUF1111 family)
MRQKAKLVLLCAVAVVGYSSSLAQGQFVARDPGIRGGSVDAGGPLDGVTQNSSINSFFINALSRFEEVEVVQGGANNGLGPRFNLNQCAGCHAQPAVGGSSPSTSAYPYVGPNPETVVFDLSGAQNTLPPFVTVDGPVREARFKYFLNADGSLGSTADGGVHALFVISGRSDAGSCAIRQPDFARNLALGNMIFRIPTPLYGAGLIENISEDTLLANRLQNAAAKAALGISGHPNRSGNDGTITRFGWKAQNKSLEMFAGEAYNVEMGVTNELFPNERPSPDEEQQGGLPQSCLLNPTPEDTTNFTGSSFAQIPSDIVQFAMFMRLLAPPTPSTDAPGGAASIARGRQLFTNIGCALCHTPSLRTAPSAFLPALNQVEAHLFSDLLVHHMGAKLADGVVQGAAGPDEFRTAPLWGLGQRVFFLHDGRSTDLLDAIREHFSSNSEANGVEALFGQLSEPQKQDLLNFLRSL